MASTGPDKWKKYFAAGNIPTKVKGEGSTGRAKLYDLSRKTVLTQLPEGTEIVVQRTTKYLGYYIVKLKAKNLTGSLADAAVAKPIEKKKQATGATENLRIFSTTLIKKGQAVTDTYNEKPYKAMRFKRPEDLQASIIHGLKTNTNVSEEIVHCVQQFFKGDMKTIKWGVEIGQTDKNELGKYLGELLIGLLAFKNQMGLFSTNFLDSRVEHFTIPTDSTFSGVDSFIRTHKGTLVPISSKFGQGAAASFFTNIVPKALTEYYPKIRECTFKKILRVIKDNNIDPAKASKRALYMYGIHYVLNIGLTKVRNVMDIYQGIRDDNWAPHTADIIHAITRKQWGLNEEETIKKALPCSLTGFFNRVIAQQLNKDAVSIEEMKRIISGKNFWQANLDTKKWNDGQVYYRMIHSSTNTLTMTGSKSPISDLGSNAGMINYTLRMG